MKKKIFSMTVFLQLSTAVFSTSLSASSTQELEKKIEEILKLEPMNEKYTEREFIQIIIKDYNYYTGKEFSKDNHLGVS
jgi:hypothetical protein